MAAPHHPQPHPPRPRQALRLTPWPAVAVSTEVVCAALPPRVHPISCPGCAFDGGSTDTPITSEPTPAWQRGMRPIGL